VKQAQDAMYAGLTILPKPKMVAGIKKTENLVRLGTVGVFDGLE